MSDRPRLSARKHYQRPHVLIVSDDPGLSAFLNEGLPLVGFWTTVIASGLQALEVFRLRRFDVIAIDAGLQSFAAMELIHRLRGLSERDPSAPARTNAPIVLVTEHPIDLPDDERRRLGIDRMYVAPVELEELGPDLHAVFDDWQDRYPSVPMSDDPLDENRSR